MQIQDFVRAYETKSDDELIRLAAAGEQLTSDAQVALRSELSRRGIHFAEQRERSQKSEESRSDPQRLSSQKSGREGVTGFLAEALRTYQRRFWLYFRIAVPAVIVSTAAILMARHENWEIGRHLPRYVDPVVYRSAALEMWLVNFAAYLVSWIASSFAFGAICIAVEETEAGFTTSATHSFWNIRERFGRFVCVSLLLFVLLTAILAAFTMLMTGVLWVVRSLHLGPTHLAILAITYAFGGLALLFFSRFTLAIPAVLLDDCQVWQAVFRSDKLTGERWLTLVALLAKSIVEGYVAAKSPFWLASLIPASAQAPWRFFLGSDGRISNRRCSRGSRTVRWASAPLSEDVGP